MCTASASWRRLPIFARSPLLCVHVSIFKATLYAALQSPLHRAQFVRWLTGAARACATTLSPTPGSWPFEVTRLRKTSHPWYALSLAAHHVHHPCLVHLSLEATADDIHSRQLCATSRASATSSPRRGASRAVSAAHGTILREDADTLALKSICAGAAERPWSFENVDHAWRDWPRERPADSRETPFKVQYASRSAASCAMHPRCNREQATCRLPHDA